MSPFVYLLIERFDIDHDKVDRERVVGVFAELSDARAVMAARVNEFRAHFTPEDAAYAERFRRGPVHVPDRLRDEVKFPLYSPTPDSAFGFGHVRGYRIDQFRMHGSPE